MSSTMDPPAAAAVMAEHPVAVAGASLWTLGDSLGAARSHARSAIRMHHAESRRIGVQRIAVGRRAGEDAEAASNPSASACAGPEPPTCTSWTEAEEPTRTPNSAVRLPAENAPDWMRYA